MKDDEGRSSSACHFERKREIIFVGGQEETGEHRKPGNAVLHTLRDHVVSFGQEKRTGNEKAPSAAFGRAIWENAPYPFLFIPLREPTSAPLGHLLP